MTYSVYFESPKGSITIVDDSCSSREEAEEIVKASQPLLKSLGIEHALLIKEICANGNGKTVTKED